MSVEPLEKVRKLCSIEPDMPIGDSAADDFEREGFARAISDQLVINPNSSSVVFGLEAHWGEGKTSLINMITSELEKSKTLIL